ncbi:MAG: hypothetical protein JXN64_01370 [Spirochaetes bacterium]|nr:hypothetical protein [Spirochaetota bacterium]
MKVIHIIKKIEAIDEDVKELRKLEKSLAKDKSFSTPIYISIEKQINILLGDRIKLLELSISNPPLNLLKDIEGTDAIETVEKKTAKPAQPSKPIKKSKSKKVKPSPITAEELDEIEEIDDIGILTQDLIDEKFARLKEEKDLNDRKKSIAVSMQIEEDDIDDDIKDESIKLLDVALESGSLNKSSLEKERKKVRFFKDNFPGGDY